MGPIDVVISGIGGRFPKSTNIEEFSENLLAGKSLLEPAKRWTPGALGTPLYLGHTDLVDKFDHSFFGMHYVLSSATDATTRIALETAFEAIVDAGVSPSEVRGTNAHVYSATSQYENDCTFGIDANPIGTGYTIMGRNKCMISNRVSHLLNLSGRSCSYDASGGWLGVGLKFARDAILSGDCDTAFVIGSSFLAVVEIGKQKQNMGLLSPDASCHPFDTEVNGFTRSEAQVAFLVQRADIAKRSYGSIAIAESESQGILPNWFLSVNEDHLRNFISTLYHKHGVDPASVKLIEADGLCNKDMIESELNVLDQVLNKKRPEQSPLFLGSVKTLMGDSDGAAGHASLTKLILAMETGLISPTIDCGRLNPNIPGLTEGRFKVVTEPTPWKVTPETHVAVSHLSHSGLVTHVVLKANGREKDPNIVNNHPIPYLIFISGRNEAIVEKSLQRVASSPFDPEFIRLTHEVFAPAIDRYDWKGYGFHGLGSSEKFMIQRSDRRPVWFVFSGMGSQWPEMGKDLMHIPIIKKTFQRLHNLLQDKGVDLINILTSSEPSIFDNILHSFLGITATQIALTNLLQQLGIEPEGIIGHSVGELGCSYADGCLTEEQTILASYERGMASLKAQLIPGLMAAVGLGYHEAKEKLPDDVFVACRNSNESCTISGPTESVKKVISAFNADGIFVRGVNVSNIAYHSPYIKPAAPFLLESLRKVIPKPKLRSPKWICTSAPQDKWDCDEVRYCSADYHTNNLLNPVLFEEASQHIPKNALVIEVAPHGLLQAILKRSLGGEAVHVPLTRRGATSPAKILLQAVGKMYLEGLSPKVWHLYPEVPMPVSRNTPSLVPLIAWEHDEIFPLNAMSVVTTKAVAYELSLSSPCMEIAGVKTLLPTYALVAVWETISKLRKREMTALPMVFEDVYFDDMISLEFEGAEEMLVNILHSREEFEITRNEVIVVKGKFHIKGDEEESIKLPDHIGQTLFRLHSDDIYSELKNRGVGISDDMKDIQGVNIYSQDWIADVTFVEEWSRNLNSLITLFQLYHCEDSQSSSYVRYIHKLVIDPWKQQEKGEGKVRLNLPSSALVTDGIELSIVKFRTVEKPEAKSTPVSLQFVPYGKPNLQNERHFLCHLIQLSLEKRLISTPIFKIYDVDGEHKNLAEQLDNILRAEFSIKCELVNEPKEATLVLCGEASIPAMASIVANEGILLLSRCAVSNRTAFDKTLTATGLHIIAESEGERANSSLVVITNEQPEFETNDCKIIKMHPRDQVPSNRNDFSCDLIILVWEKGTREPIEEIFRKVSILQNAEAFRLVFLMSENCPPFSLHDPLYANQIRLNVPVNIYRDGEWGCYHLIPLPQNYQQSMNQEVVLSQTPDNRNSDVKLKYFGLNFERHAIQPLTTLTLDYSGEINGQERVMGIATYDGSSGKFVRDSHLYWNIPQNWTYEEAATVPCAYALTYFALLELAQMKNHQTDSMLVTCPLSPVGQAFINIAASVNCEVVVLISNPRERELLQELFSKIKLIFIEDPTSDMFHAKVLKHFPKGVDLIVSDLSGSRLRSATACYSLNGRLLQIGTDLDVSSDYLRLSVFLRATHVFVITEDKFLDASSAEKQRVVEWVQKGLDDGTIRPNVLRRKYLSRQYNEAVRITKNDTEKRIVSLEEEKKEPSLSGTRGHGAVIIGGSKAQWIRLAHHLARKGCKQIVLVQDHSSPSFVVRHAQLLRRDFGSELTELDVKRGADLVNRLSATGTVFAFSQNNIAEEVVREMEARGLKDTQVVFFSKESTHLSRMCERWVRKGLKIRAALGVEDVPADGVTPILDWLLSPDAPTVTVLNGPIFLFKKLKFANLSESRLFPDSAKDLQTLGAYLRGKTSPVFRELITRSTNVKRNVEVQPLFFLKGIHGSATEEMENIAKKLIAPMVEVTLHGNCGSLEDSVRAVLKGIQKIQPRGPYNLAGDPIRTDILIKVASILENQGHASVVFVMDEGYDLIREELTLWQNSNKLNVSILKSGLFEEITPQNWKSIKWSKMTWDQQKSIAVSHINWLNEEERQDVIIALDHVKNSVEHIIGAQEKIELNHCIVRSLRRGDDYQKFKLRERYIAHTIPSSKLKQKDIADIICPTLAAPVLQLNIVKAQRRFKKS